VASLTFAVEHLGCGLVVVLGHTNCGAVRAALDDSPDPVLAPVLAPILAPIDEMLAACQSCDGDLDAAVAANVAHNLRRLRRNRGPLGNAIAEGRAVLRGAVHDLATGRLIEITEEGPAGESPALSVPIP
jgi:carbonic anhydrase